MKIKTCWGLQEEDSTDFYQLNNSTYESESDSVTFCVPDLLNTIAFLMSAEIEDCPKGLSHKDLVFSIKVVEDNREV